MKGFCQELLGGCKDAPRVCFFPISFIRRSLVRGARCSVPEVRQSRP